MNILKYLFFSLIVKPFIFIGLGLNVRCIENLPKKGPAILIANHNSHVDTFALMSLFPGVSVNEVHPVAAADYFFNTKLRSFFFKNLIGAIPLKRTCNKSTKETMFAALNKALEDKHILIIFPEGTRGEDNEIKQFKSGVGHLASTNPDVPIIPIFINGPDKVLPKYDCILVPFICDIFIGEKIYYSKELSNKDFIQKTQTSIVELKNKFENRK